MATSTHGGASPLGDSATSEHYDPMSPDAKAGNDETFGVLRRTCPVHRHTLPPETAERINASPLVARPVHEFFSLFRYEDCLGVLQDPARYSSKEGPGPERLMPLNEDGMLVYADDPAHIRQRRIVVRGFSPRAIEALRPRIGAIVDELVDGFASQGAVDVVRAFSVPLTVRVIVEILGADPQRAEDFGRWGNATIAAFGGDPAAAASGFVAMQEMFGYLQPLIDERRRMVDAGDDLPEDVLTALVTADIDGTRFTDAEVLMACQQLLVAGYETTATAIGNAVYLLCTHPEERRRVEQDLSLVGMAVEEVLRRMAPVEGVFRTTTEDVEVAGEPIPAGAKVRIVFASANLDDGHFDDPLAFRLDRAAEDVRRHIAFGFGKHSCLGAALARAEMQAALTALLERLPGFALDPDAPPVRTGAFLMNGFESVPVRWDPALVR